MNRSRIKLLLLFALFAAPFTLAWLTYKFWSPSSFVNRGQLLDPVGMLGDIPVTVAGQSQAWQAQPGLAGKWVLLHTDSLPCAEACQAKLYALRQSHVALGKNQERVKRAFLLDAGQIPDAVATDLAKDVVWLSGQSLHQALLAKVPPGGSTRDFIFVVDPLGNLFMRYQKDAEIKGIIKDMERVLKASRIG